MEIQLNSLIPQEAKNESKLSEQSQKQSKFVHRDPFEFMKINDNKFLDEIDGRSSCTKCNKSRKFFCYTCCLPVAGIESKLPKVNLPLQIDIIKHPKEIDGKSTAIHAAVLAPKNVKIYTYPDIPDYTIDRETVKK